MAIRTYKVTLDSKNTIAPEPVYLRQGDKTGAVVIDATLMDNGSPVSLSGLTPMFKANTADGQAVIADSTGFNIVNASGGEFTYQVPSQLGSVDGKIKIAYFSFSDSSGAQSTFNVVFVVEKAADMTQESAKDWVSNLNEIISQYNQWVNDAHSSWQDFVNANKKIIESIDPGGTLLTEVIDARNGNSNLKTRLDNEHTQVTEQLAEKVHKDFYEVKYNPSTKLIDTVDFQNQINSGIKYFRIPSNMDLNVSSTVYLKDFVKIVGENSSITANSDLAILATIAEGSHFEGIEITGIKFIKNAGQHYHIEIADAYKLKINKCYFDNTYTYGDSYDFNLKAGVKIEKQTSDCFVNYIENCFFRRSNIDIKTTDSHIRNNIIWAYSQECAIFLSSCSNIEISGNQFIGSDSKGAIYMDTTASACGLLRITNNFFDGSYDGVKSGTGIYGYCTLTEISSNAFYNQSKESIVLVNPNRNIITDNVFTENNKDGLGVAEISFVYSASTNFMNMVKGNMFSYTRLFDYYCISENIQSGTPTIYNQYVSNMAPVGRTYTGFNSGSTSGAIKDNQFGGLIVTNAKRVGSIASSIENVTVDYSVANSVITIVILGTSCNFTIVKAGSLKLGTLPLSISPQFEINTPLIEYDKDSKLRLSILADGSISLKNWTNNTTGLDQTVTNFKAYATYALS